MQHLNDYYRLEKIDAPTWKILVLLKQNLSTLYNL